jgi:hypothetical protein
MESVESFERSVWAAYCQLFIDYDEAIKAINDYKLDYATIYSQDHKPN